MEDEPDGNTEIISADSKEDGILEHDVQEH